MKVLLTLLLPAALLLAAPSKKQAAADAALEKLQSSWDETRSYQADFTQTVQSKATQLMEEPVVGSLAVIKPDRLRWEDKTSQTTQILNGKEYWEISKTPRRPSRTVIYRPDVSRGLGQTSFAILAGKGKFQDFYTVKFKSETPKEAVLQFTPHGETSETLIAKIDKNGYVLRSLTTDSQDSRVVVEFKNIQRNPALDKKLFQYEKEENDVFQTRKD
jgi:chaperone LolA